MKTKCFSLRRGAETISLLLSTIALLASVPTARAESPSDLMEQGIYSEETKGDLNGAMEIYKKVIAQGDAAEAVAAEAQYHLGVCYYKGKNYDSADAAFQTLIKRYPEQKDLVAKAREYLARAHPLQPVPWTDGEDMRLSISLSGGLKIGLVDYRANLGLSTNGQKIWKCSSHTVAGGVQAVSSAEVDADTFAPIHSRWKHTLLGNMDTVYYPDHADLRSIAPDSDGSVKKLTFDEPVIDNEEAIEWMRRMPFAAGYTNTQEILASLGSHILPVTATVSGPENVTVPLGTYSCYKVELSIGQTFWYSADTNHYLVKFEAGGAVAALTSVTHPAPDAQDSYTFPAPFNYSLTGPPGWFFDAQQWDKKGAAGVLVVDPDGLSETTVSISTLDNLGADAKKTLRNYASEKTEAASKMYAEYHKHGELADRSVAGHDGVAMAVDCREGKSKKSAYGVWTIVSTNIIYFQTISAPKDFPAMQKKLDAIIDSFKIQ
jgi:tetratricopeptide (TPR) repeat protein